MFLFYTSFGKEMVEISIQQTPLQKEKRDYLASFLALIPFLILAYANIFRLEWLETMDQQFGSAAVAIRNDSLTIAARFITLFGGPKVSGLILIFIFVLFFFFLKKKRLALWYLLTGVFGAGVLNQLVKYSIRKPRPEFEHLVVQGGYTFPSGHSMGSLVIYGGLLFLLLRWSRFQKSKYFWAAGLGLFILLIGLSRIYLGVHFASDIIGGYSLGASALLASIGWYHARERKVLTKVRSKTEK